jgi:hypothetical protein
MMIDESTPDQHLRLCPPFSSHFTDDAWVAFFGVKHSSRKAIVEMRKPMWTSIIKRHHRAERVFVSNPNELAIYGSALFTGADGKEFNILFWARMKFEDADAQKPKMVEYEVNKRCVPESIPVSFFKTRVLIRLDLRDVIASQ